MANLPNDPVTVIPEPARRNGDLPVAPFPELQRIERDDLVGPVAANRQHQSLEKRTETLHETVNKLVQLVNQIDTTFLRKNNTQAKDNVTGPLAAISWNLQKIVDLADGLVDAGSKEAVNGGQLAAAITALTAAVNALTEGTSFSIVKDVSGVLRLINDSATPPAGSYWGTDSAGVRGFHSLPDQTPGATLPTTRVEFATQATTTAWVVPAGVTEIYVTVRGGNGGNGGDLYGYDGGGGES